jgi:hypothetical protein
MKLDIQKLAGNIYSNPAAALKLVDKYDLRFPLTSAIQFIRRHKKAGDHSRLFRAAGTLLTLFNNRIERINDSADKANCQQLVVDFLEDDLSVILEAAGEKEREMVILSLVDACELNGYDLGDVKRRLKLEQDQSLKKRSINGQAVRPDSVLNYELVMTDDERDKFYARIMSSTYIFKSRKDLETLFKKASTSVVVNINPENLDLLLVLIAEMHKRKLLLVKGRSGKFLPLSQKLGYSDSPSLKKLDISSRYSKLLETRGKHPLLLDSVRKLLVSFE